ncbi:hypothetical protein DL95DRAFT_449616 [Leptodontidium sp. 2 PMI_412]|nr:hypothetical protein DL95DRAFT_449616 [Leptodontidium sp. 2 PMI_412]
MSGLEVIGSVASVLQLAATVYSISKTLYEVGDALSNAPSDIKDLARDLETFSEELHLLSSLLSDQTHRYSDRVYRLTAKIIGDCASICVKIDRILRKLRSGSFVARVKWVFKEKEIMKLLARLRDLKLSLMGTLSLLSALKADHLMDAMGVGNPSLLEGPKDERLSKKTAEDLEETRKKLGGITAGQNPGSSLPATVSGSTLTPPVSQSSEDCQQSVTSSEKGTDASDASQSFSSSATSLKSTVSSHVSPEPRSIEQPNAQIFISAIALPQPNVVMQIPHAMASVQSFYSAFSRHDNEDLEGADTMNGNIAASDITPSSTKTHSPQKLADSRVEEWKADIIHSAMKRFGMTREDAISWVSALPVPSFPDSGVQHNAFLVDEDPERVQKKTDDAGGTGPKGMGQMSRNFRRFACPARPLTPSPERYCQVAMDSDEGRAWLKVNRQARRRMRRSSKSVRKRTLAQSIGSSSDDEDIVPAVFERTNEAGRSARLRRKIAGERTGLLFDRLLIGRDDALDADSDFEETRGGSNDNWEIPRSIGKRPFKGVEDIEDSLSDTAAEEFHENQVQIEIDDSYNQQATEECITTVDLPGQWISDGDYSEDTHHGVKRRVTTRPDERSLAEGALSGAGSAALLRDHDTATIPSPWKRGKPTGQTTPSTLASKLSNLTLGVDSGRSSPASEDSAGTPPVPITWKRGRPAALCLATLNTKPRQQAKLSQATQSLKSARRLTVHISSVYPPGISPPKGDGLRYDIEFLLQFQKVFTEEPTIDFKSILEALNADGNKVSTGSVLKRKVQGVIVGKHPISNRPASARSGLGTKVPTSEDRREIDVRGAALGAVGVEVITRARSRYRESGQDKSQSPTKGWSGPWNATPVSQQHVSQNVSDEDAGGEESEDERNQDVDYLMLPSPANAQIPEEKTEEDDDAMYENGFQDDFFSYEQEMGDADEDVDDLKDEIQFSSQPARLEDSLRKIPVPAPPFLSDYRQNDLWVRAFAQLYAQDSESCQGLSRAWVAACENSPPLTGSEHLVAGMAATRLWSVVDKARMQLLETPTEAKRSTISSINRFSDILKVMQETLNFKTGFYIWTCLCFVEQEILESLSMSQVSKNSRTVVDLSEVATLVARYNVLESMYKQWPGMSLESNYENSLIELCVRVLRYLDLVLSRPSTSGQNDFEERVALMAMIRSADVACRGFSVTIVGEVESKGMERDVEDISADEDDSDSTERG